MELKPLLFENISPKQIVFKNTFWLYSANIISKILKFFLVVYAARILGPLNYGVFNYVIYLVGLFFMFSDLGIGSFLIREYQKENINKDKIISLSFLIKFGLIILGIIIAVTSYFLIKDALVKNILFALVIMMILNNIRDFFVFLAQANNKMELSGVSNVIETAVTTILGLFLLFKTNSLFYFSVAYLFGSLFSLIYIFVVTSKYFPKIKNWSFDLGYAKNLLFFSLPFAASSIIGFLLSIDVVMIKWLKNVELVGQYSIGLKIIGLLFIIPNIFTTALYPIFSKFAENKNHLLNILKSSTSYLFMVGIPIFFGGIILADRLIIGFFGGQYNLGVAPFKILIFVVPLYFLIVMLDYLLMSLNYQMKNMIFTSIAAVCNLILSFFLIQYYSISGAAFAVVLSQFVNLLLKYNFAKKVLGGHFLDLGDLFKFTIASIAMGSFIFVGLHPIFTTFVLMFLAIAIYFLVLYALKEKNLFYLVNLFTRKCAE